MVVAHAHIIKGRFSMPTSMMKQALRDVSVQLKQWGLSKVQNFQCRQFELSEVGISEMEFYWMCCHSAQRARSYVSYQFFRRKWGNTTWCVPCIPWYALLTPVHNFNKLDGSTPPSEHAYHGEEGRRKILWVLWLRVLTSKSMIGVRGRRTVCL